jgi:hypothetical protein
MSTAWCGCAPTLLEESPVHESSPGTAQVTFHMAMPHYERLSKAAVDSDRTISGEIRSAIRRHLNELDGKPTLTKGSE